MNNKSSAWNGAVRKGQGLQVRGEKDGGKNWAK